MSDLLPKTREICRLFEIKPARTKGQNFLINEKIYDDIVAAAEVKVTDTILEIGPGLGFLTAKLARKARRVVAVELDDQLAHYLQMGLDSQDIDNVEIVNEDILKFNLSAHIDQTTAYKIVANLPYNISSVFLRLFLSGRQRPDSLVLMLQKEVAERITACVPHMSILAISVQYYAEVEIIKNVKSGNFWPEPKVDSAIVKFKLRPEKYSRERDKLFFRLVKAGFSAKRKMLKNNLAGGLKKDQKAITFVLEKYGISAQARAEELSLDDWQKIFAALAPFMI